MAVLTVNQIIDNIDSFVNNIKKLSKSYYVFIGRPYPWPDENNPPTANASVEQTELTVYRDMIYGKMISNTDVSYMIRYVPWTNNTVYAQYNQYSANLIQQNFFVTTDLREVYKCIYNNSNSASVIKPSLNLTTGAFKTSDGYIWKYMYTIDPAIDTKFTTPGYIPVSVNAAVESAAVPGTIDYITITNPGNGYEIYEEGFLLGISNNGYEVILSNTAAQVDDYYVGSTLYLKAGGGAGQIREVINYSGLDRRLRVDSPFATYINMNLEDVNGTISVGDTITQNLVDISHYYDQGYFPTNSTIVQTDTAAVGTIISGNSSHFIVTTDDSANAFIFRLPFYNTSEGALLKSGTVTITSGNNQAIANTGTDFTTDYSIGQFIRVGSDANTQLRRITAVNTSVITVDANTPFTSDLAANVHYLVPYASVPTSVSVLRRSGIVTFTNLNGINIDIANTTPIGKTFFPGENVIQVDEDNVSQGANAIISFSNSSLIQLSSVNGTFVANLYVLGLSSNVKSLITSVTSYPNITISQPTGEFEIGRPIFSSSLANAMLVSYSTVPGSLTEYIISPNVDIQGDGDGALAYAYVDTSGANPSREISDIVMINQGQNYTYSSVTISSNSQYGANATATASISPLTGHGSNTYIELGAKYAGISMSFANGSNEGYKFPITGKYRRVGILETPTYSEAILTLDTFDRVKLYLGAGNGTDFIKDEIVVQPYTNAAGVVVYSNSSYLELKNVLGTDAGLPFYTYATNHLDTKVIGLTSNAQANVLTTASNNTANSTVSYFEVLSNVEIISDITTGGSSKITQSISNTEIRISNIQGHISGNDYVYDAATNAYARVVSILVSNGQIDKTTAFAHTFNQTCRIPLTSNTGEFLQFETVKQQSTNATGKVLTFNDDRDLVFISTNGAFSTGDILTNNTTGGSAIVLQANGSNYVKCTAVTGVFENGDNVVNQLDIGGNLLASYPTLVLYDVDNQFVTGSYVITGSNSGATGVNVLTNSITYPELVRGSGATSYIENVAFFERSATSDEKINIVIKF